MNILIAFGLFLFGVIVGIILVLFIDKEATDEVVKHHLW